MLKKTITYEDFNGETISEDFFFHLSKAELVELELSHQGGLSEALQRIIDAEDGKSIIAEFKNIILGAYGKKSLDGKRFVKNHQLREEFESSEAYSTLFMELVTDAGAAADFVNGVIPKGMAEEAAKLAAGQDKPMIKGTAVSTEETHDHTPVLTPVLEPKIVTKKDIEEMAPEEIATLGDRIQAGEIKITQDIE